MPVLQGDFANDFGHITGTISAEAGCTLKVTSDRAGDLLTVPATGAPQPIAFDLSLGTHNVSIVAVDAAGNTSPALTTTLTYSAPDAPKLHQRHHQPGAPLVVSIDGPANGSSHSVLSDGQTKDLPLNGSGQTTAKFVVSDGHYSLDVSVADKRGSGSPTAHLNAHVDTVNPRLRLRIDKHAAESGKLRFSVRAEEGAKVRVHTKGTRLNKRYRAGSKTHTFTKDVGSGHYRVQVTATDSARNRSSRTARVSIS